MDMLQPLIERLKIADLSEVAATSKVSRKTLARIRDRVHGTTFATASKITAALDALGVKKVKPTKATPSTAEQG